MAWKKGQSGNPGRRPREKPFLDALRVALNEEGDDGQRKLRTIAARLVDAAVAGESWAIQHVADRLDGRPTQINENYEHYRSINELSDDELMRMLTENSHDEGRIQ